MPLNPDAIRVIEGRPFFWDNTTSQEISRCSQCHLWHPTQSVILSNDRYYCPHCRASWPLCARCDTPHQSLTFRDDRPGARLRAYICSDCYTATHPRCGNCREAFQEALLVDTFCLSCRRSLRHLANPTYTRNPEHRKVGVEIEFITTRPSQPVAWGRIKGDGSVRVVAGDPMPSVDGTRVGREFNTLPLSGDLLFTAIEETCAQFAPNSYVNSSCGLHVHLDIADITSLGKQRIKDWWLVYENIFYSIIDRNRAGNSYCTKASNLTNWSGTRYAGLNIASPHGTFEWRLHHGTINPDEIKDWVRILLAFVRTHKDINLGPQLKEELSNLTHRQLLIFMFRQMGLPLELRKSIVERILKHQRRYTSQPHALRKFKGHSLDLSKPKPKP